MFCFLSKLDAEAEHNQLSAPDIQLAAAVSEQARLYDDPRQRGLNQLNADSGHYVLCNTRHVTKHICDLSDTPATPCVKLDQHVPQRIGVSVAERHELRRRHIEERLNASNTLL